jgi:hypothetical protein
MVNQKANVAAWGIKLRCRQIRGAKHCAGSSERVYRIGLTASSAEFASRSHQAGWNPKYSFTGAEQISFEFASHRPAVLQSPLPLYPLMCPQDSIGMAFMSGFKGALSKLATVVVNSDHGVAELVRVRAEYDNVPCLLSSVEGTRTGQWTNLSWGSSQVPIKSRWPVHIIPPGRRHFTCKPRTMPGSVSGSQSAGGWRQGKHSGVSARTEDKRQRRRERGPQRAHFWCVSEDRRSRSGSPRSLLRGVGRSGHAEWAGQIRTNLEAFV